MRLVAGLVLEAFVAGAERDHPVRPHLNAIVHRLQRFIVEGVFAGFLLGRPDERLMGIGQTLATEIRHRVRLAPNHVVEDPEALVLKFGAHAENVVIAADHPDRAVGLQKTAGRRKPIAGEFVIDLEAVELIPMIVNGIDLGIIGSVQIAAQLQVIGRIREDKIDGFGRKTVHHLDAIAIENRIQRERRRALDLGFGRHVCLFDGGLARSLIDPNVSQRRFAVKRFFESMGYELFLIQDIVHGFERKSMMWGHP